MPHANRRKPDELVALIREAGAHLSKAEIDGCKQQLRLAIILGEYLIEAKANPTIGARGKWEDWFQKHDFDFSYRKALRCMRFAKNRQKLEGLLKKPPDLAILAADGRLTITAADTLLRKTKAVKAPKSKAAIKHSKSPDRVAAFAALDADEIADNIKHSCDQDKQLRLLVRQLKANVDHVYEALDEALDVDQLQSLTARLNNRSREASVIMPKYNSDEADIEH